MSKEEPIPGLRDFFASSALSILSREDLDFDPEWIANYCYTQADAMLAEREKHNATTN